MAELTKKEHLDKGDFIKNELLKYLRYWYWFVLGIVIAVIAANLHLRYTPKIYSSQAKISILEDNKGLDLSEAFFKSSNVNLEKEIEILKSYPIIEKVVRNQDLTMKYYVEGDVLTTEIDNLPFNLIKTIDNDSITNYFSYHIIITQNGIEVKKPGSGEITILPHYSSLGIDHNLPFEINLSGEKIPSDAFNRLYIISFSPVKDVTKGLKNAVQVDRLGNRTNLLRLGYNSQSIAKNERILNELIRVFNQDGIDDRRSKSFRTLQFIDTRFNALALELDSLETDIKEFKQENKITSIDSRADAGMTKLSLTEERLFDLENQLMLLDLLKETLNTNGSNPELLPANVGVSGGNVNSLVSEYNDLVLEFAKYGTSAGQNNPQFVILREQLAELKSNIFSSISSLKIQLEATKRKVEQKNESLTSEIYSIPAKEKMFLDIKRQQEIKQELYIYLLQKREEAAVNYAITEPSIKVVENALSSGVPISPDSNSTYLKALIAGLVIPFGCIYLFFLFDTKLKNRNSIEQITTKIPVLAELPKLKSGENNLAFLSPNDNTAQAEAFRILTYNLNYVVAPADTNKAKVIFCTSTIKGEGKTYISLNLSLAFSSLDKKVLLIGSDLRNPQIHNFIGRDKEFKGLTNYLFDTDFDWKSSLIKNFEEHPNHDILLSGSIPPNPTKLLTNGRFDKLLEDAKKSYDYIIIDTAPTILVSDTLLISSLADVTVYVTRSNFTEKKLVQYSKGLSESGKIKNMAYVVNALDGKKAHGYGYGYGYNYGYSYGYGTKTKS